MAGKPAAPKDETKAQKFARLAAVRVNGAAEFISKIGGLATSAYDYTEADVLKIEEFLVGEVKKATGRLRNPASAPVGGFKL